MGGPGVMEAANRHVLPQQYKVQSLPRPSSVVQEKVWASGRGEAGLATCSPKASAELLNNRV